MRKALKRLMKSLVGLNSLASNSCSKMIHVARIHMAASWKIRTLNRNNFQVGRQLYRKEVGTQSQDRTHL